MTRQELDEYIIRFAKQHAMSLEEAQRQAIFKEIEIEGEK